MKNCLIVLLLNCSSIFFQHSLAQQKLPTASIIAPMLGSCVGATLNFTNNSSDAEIIKWKLTGPENSISDNNIFSFYFSHNGNYVLKLIASNNAGVDSTSIDINIYSLPEVSIHQKPVSASESNDGNLISEVKGGKPPYAFDWSNGSTVANQFDVAAGLYTLTVTDYNGCKVEASVIIETGSGPTDLFHEAGVNIYPFINEGKVGVEWIRHFSRIEFVLFNSSGIIMKQYQFIETDNGSIEFKDLNQGMYILKIVTNEKVLYRKLFF